MAIMADLGERAAGDHGHAAPGAAAEAGGGAEGGAGGGAAGHGGPAERGGRAAALGVPAVHERREAVGAGEVFFWYRAV